MITVSTNVNFLMMKKQILTLGKALTKAEQQEIHGGGMFCCEWCPDGSCNGWVSSPKETCPFAPPC